MDQVLSQAVVLYTQLEAPPSLLVSTLTSTLFFSHITRAELQRCCPRNTSEVVVGEVKGHNLPAPLMGVVCSHLAHAHRSTSVR